LQTQIKEWVLGYMPSAYSMDKRKLKDIQNEKEELINDIPGLTRNARKINQLQQEELLIQTKIDAGLETVVDQ
jgi:uncharacterized membrane protein (DUF106 family)